MKLGGDGCPFYGPAIPDSPVWIASCSDDVWSGPSKTARRRPPGRRCLVVLGARRRRRPPGLCLAGRADAAAGGIDRHLLAAAGPVSRGDQTVCLLVDLADIA